MPWTRWKEEVFVEPGAMQVSSAESCRRGERAMVSLVRTRLHRGRALGELHPRAAWEVRGGSFCQLVPAGGGDDGYLRVEAKRLSGQPCVRLQ